MDCDVAAILAKPDVRCKVAVPGGGYVVNGSATVAVGESVQYGCQVYHTMIGGNTVVCRSDGTMSSNPPKCSRKFIIITCLTNIK